MGLWQYVKHAYDSGRLTAPSRPAEPTHEDDAARLTQRLQNRQRREEWRVLETAVFRREREAMRTWTAERKGTPVPAQTREQEIRTVLARLVSPETTRENSPAHTRPQTRDAHEHER